MSESGVVVDAVARARITTELNRNLLVEAGAGSGKTQKLAERMAAGIATGTYELEHMAAVTFTRKAAAELRGRFQVALEAELGRESDTDRHARIQFSLGNLERFFAGTIHSFCARLLRERPVEAGVSPGFTELDDAEEALLRQRSWRDYRSQARASGDPDLLELLDAGMTAKQLDKGFETVCLYEDVTFPTGDVSLPDASAAWRALETFWTSLSALLPAPIDPETTCKTQQRADRFGRQWRAFLRGDRRHSRLAELLKTWESKADVTLMRWPNGQGRAAKVLYEDFREATVLPHLTAWRQYLYGRCIALLTKARAAAKEERLRRNSLSFNDLLLITADVLRSNADVRRALQRKYRWLLVDEFQDTDPIQAEIMFLLAADEEGSRLPAPGSRARGEEGFRLAAPGSRAKTRAGKPRASAPMPLLAGLDLPRPSEAGSLEPFSSPEPRAPSRPLDWRTVALRPGALFVVGDPKQSIYRFRRADIEIYNDVRTRLAGADGAGVLRLVTNFRAVPALCEWANQVFEKTFPPAPTPRSPMFAPLVAHRSPHLGVPEIAVLDLSDVADSDQVAIQEATRIARFVRTEVDAGRRGFGDFLILTRKKKSLRPYAAALEALHVPVEVTGAGAFDESAEVREIALLLAALADPQDAVSLVGVLRGSLFGLSDQDLFAFRQAGGYFNLFADVETTARTEAARVSAALAMLRRWHVWTRTLPAGAALERIFEDSGYLALAATSRGGVEAGDLLHAIDRVRSVMETGFTLAEAADALASWCGLDDDGPGESTEVDSLPLEPGRRDVVRLMNLHKAKGLEAEVVFLVDPLGGFEPRVDVRIVRDGDTPLGYFQIQEESSGFARRVLAEPAGWSDHKTVEEAYLVAELDRLMYVAATRARDTLVVGVWPGRPGNRKLAWPALLAHVASAPRLVVPADVALPVAAPIDLSAVAAARGRATTESAHALARYPSWAATSVTAEVKRLPRLTIEVADADAREDATRTIVPDTPSHRADAGQAWGTLVHGLLEHAMRHPSATPADLGRLGLWLTVDEPQLRGVLDRAVATALAVVASDELKPFRAGLDVQEEVPFAVCETRDGVRTVVTGAIDLVHRSAGGWRVVDYKTDRDGADTPLARRYAEQVRAYEEAWKRVSGEPVTSAIVSCRS